MAYSQTSILAAAFQLGKFLKLEPSGHLPAKETGRQEIIKGDKK
jgi:hypothetical protein